jgi:acyl dehydratase
VPRRYFEDFHAGEIMEVGSVTLTEEAIIAFARQYDPQPFHTDPEAAKSSMYGGLIASGWHTVSLFMNLIVTRLLLDSSSLGSPGVDELRWPMPVRPGDTLTGRMHSLETRVSNSRPTMGILRWRGEMHNQKGELVLSLLGTNFFGRQAG